MKEKDKLISAIKNAFRDGIMRFVGMVYEDDKEELGELLKAEGWKVEFKVWGMVGNPYIEYEVTPK